MGDIEHLLVPMDGSPLSKRALRVAFAEYPDAGVSVLYVVDPTDPGYSYPTQFDPYSEPLHGSEEWYERSEELAAELFDEIESIAAEYDTEVATETTIGEPGREIVDYVMHNDVDQVVIGSHGRDDAELSLLGSVTESVVFRCPVRVLLVR
jgi:nucleotide-binding universal stress UspA family protein